MGIGKMEAIKGFFGAVRPVTTQELLELRRASREGFDELAEGASQALGETLVAEGVK